MIGGNLAERTCALFKSTVPSSLVKSEATARRPRGIAVPWYGESSGRTTIGSGAGRGIGAAKVEGMLMRATVAKRAAVRMVGSRVETKGKGGDQGGV